MVKPIEIVYTIVGEVPSETATTSIKLAATEVLAKIQGFAVAFATLLNNITLGKILSAVFVIDVDISALTGNLELPASDVEEIAALQFQAGSYFTDVSVPGLSELDVLADTHEIDQAETDWANFLDAMINGVPVTGGTMLFTDNGEELITGLVYAREEKRNSGRRRKS